jgi:hypothetical protein
MTPTKSITYAGFGELVDEVPQRPAQLADPRSNPTQRTYVGGAVDLARRFRSRRLSSARISSACRSFCAIRRPT